MPTDTEETPVVRYSVTDAAIAELRTRLTGLTATSKDGYRACVKGIAETRKLRGEVEKRRVTLKADALAWSRKVDGEAKRITSALLEIEEPLRLSKEEHDESIARMEREEAEAEQRRLDAIEQARKDAEAAALAAERAELARQRAEMEAQQKAERERVAAEQAKERERLAAERAKMEAEQRAENERRRAEQEKIDAVWRAVEAEQRALEVEKQRVEREEYRRRVDALAEQKARERVERERIAAEAKRKADAEAAAAEAKRVAALAPDRDKLRTLATVIRGLVMPEVRSPEAQRAVDTAAGVLKSVAKNLEAF